MQHILRAVGIKEVRLPAISLDDVEKQLVKLIAIHLLMVQANELVIDVIRGDYATQRRKRIGGMGDLLDFQRALLHGAQVKRGYEFAQLNRHDVADGTLMLKRVTQADVKEVDGHKRKLVAFELEDSARRHDIPEQCDGLGRHAIELGYQELGPGRNCGCKRLDVRRLLCARRDVHVKEPGKVRKAGLVRDGKEVGQGITEGPGDEIDSKNLV